MQGQTMQSPDSSASVEEISANATLPPRDISGLQATVSLANECPSNVVTVEAVPSFTGIGAAARLTSTLPASFGRYRLIKLLGQGGMGAVYLAHDDQLDRPVALKVPFFEAGDRTQVMSRFEREARAAATLLHPNICPLYDVGVFEGMPYLTMAYVDGKPLSESAAAAPLTFRQSAALIRKLALALQEAHDRGVIHRDLKPANVMIDKRGEPIIMDFGLARRTRAEDRRLTRTGFLLGTPAYAPPEQANANTDAMGPASDIYSLGVILYELLTGRLPFLGDAIAVMIQATMDEPPRPSTLRTGIPADLEEICLKAMAKRPADRHVSMKQMALALSDFLRCDKIDPEPAFATDAALIGADKRSSSASELRPATSLPTTPVPLTRVVKRRPVRRATIGKRRRIPAWMLVTAGCLIGAAAGGLSYWMTNFGTIAIQLVEGGDRAELRIDGNAGGRADEPIRLRPGTHELEVIANGYQPLRQNFNVRRGDNAPLLIELQHVSVASTDAPSLAKVNASKPKPKDDQTTPPANKQDKGEELMLIRWEGWGNLTAASMSHFGRFCLVSGEPETTRLYDIQKGAASNRKLEGSQALYVPNGKEIVTGMRTGAVYRVYETATSAVRQFRGKGELLNFVVSPRGDRILSSSAKAQYLLDMKDGKELKRWSCDPSLTPILWTPDGQYVMRQVDGKLPWRVFSTETGAEIQALSAITGIKRIDGFFPRGQRAYGRVENRLHIYNVNTGRETGMLDLGTASVETFTLCPDGKRALTAHKDHKIRLWDLLAETEIVSFPAERINQVKLLSFSADGCTACAGGKPGWVYVWRLPQ
jgi:predicted Ser/Thr protein kinase